MKSSGYLPQPATGAEVSEAEKEEGWRRNRWNLGAGWHGASDTLLWVAVRGEEGGQVESWVSESVGGAEHA